MGCPAMDRGERLGRALDAFGGNLWALVDAALDAAARDRPDELRARRDSIVERLYAAAAGCSNCAGRPPSVAALAAAGLEEEDGEEAAPASPWAEADAQAGGAEAQTEVLGAGEPDLESKIVAIRDFLEDPNQVPKEAIFTNSQRKFAPNARSFFTQTARLWCFVTARERAGELAAEPGRHGCYLQRTPGQVFFCHFVLSLLFGLPNGWTNRFSCLFEMIRSNNHVKGKVLKLMFVFLQETDIGRQVNGLRKHPSAEVRRLVKQLIR